MTVIINAVPFPHPEGGEYTAEEVEKLVQHAAKRRSKLRSGLTKPKNAAALGAAQHTYVGSAQVRFAAMVEAAKDLPFSRRKPIPHYVKLAGDLKLWQQISEPVHLRAKKKFGGGYRSYFDFGVRHRTAQIVASDLIRPQCDYAAFQYDVAGKGVQKAIAAARAYIKQGYRYGLHVDIQRYFDSFHHSAIYGPAISMDQDIKSMVLTGEHYNVKLDVKSAPLDVLTHYASQVASAGIPQGSSVSPLVADFFMSKLDLKQLPEGVVVLNYVDDFLILGVDVASAEKGSHALQSALTDLSAGDFTLAQKSHSDPDDFVFLGHEFHVGSDGNVSIKVLEAAANRFLDKYLARAELLKMHTASKISSKGLSASQATTELTGHVRELIQWVKSWLLACREADDMPEHQQHFELEIDMLCDEIGVLNGNALWASTKVNKAMRYFFSSSST